MATKKTAKPVEKPAGTYIVVVAEYDECGSDGLAIDNALGFDTPEEAAKFIAEDFNDTICSMVESGDIDEDKMLDEARVLAKIKTLGVEENAEWNTPEDTPVWVKWKVFRKDKAEDTAGTVKDKAEKTADTVKPTAKARVGDIRAKAKGK